MNPYHPSQERYNGIEYRRCGKSGLMLPPISLGLWHNFGDGDRLETCRQTLQRAFDLGITHFDLANNYGCPPGSAEKNFGRILSEDFAAYRDEMIISSKAGYRMWDGPYGEWGSRKQLLASLDQSLKRTGIEYFDIFYSHRYDPYTPLEETMGALSQAVRQGKVLYAGISSYRPVEARKAIGILRELGTPCLIHQPSYNMFNRWIEGGLTDVLSEEGVGCIVFSPLAQGQLTDRYLAEIPAGSRAARSETLNAEQVRQNMDKVRALNTIALKRGQTLAQMAIAWVLRQPVVTSALVGASSPTQLEDSFKALQNLSFAPEELEEIESILKQ